MTRCVPSVAGKQPIGGLAFLDNLGMANDQLEHSGLFYTVSPKFAW